VRESGLGATAHVPGQKENWEGWEDSAVAPEQVGAYLRGLKKLYDKYHYVGSLYGHFGQGCIHTRIDFDLKTAAGVKKFRSFLDDATSLVTEFGGSLSGEHGDGQSRAEFLQKMFGPELIEAFHEFKTIWDPDWKMNPGKVVRPFRVDENLRYGSHYNPPEPETYFHYAADGFSFSRAMERCVGVGKCRRHEAGTMCPSYHATGEEMHTTRGRARLLFEMLRGDVLHDGWRSEPVKEALDLCLACKGCKGECPVHVDMATYKAEFLAHYYEGWWRFRPLSAYVFGYIHRWARLASVAPKLANFFSQTRGFSDAMKWVVGIAPERHVPAFAEENFKTWFAEREVRNADRPGVVLWPDTFNTYFHPHVAKAATAVLEDAGFRVIVPKQNMCCGRPFYDFGLLKPARKYLENILHKLAPDIEAGTPVVVLEPSCCSVFRDELLNVIPHNENAMRLRGQTFTLAEFLTKKAPGYRAPLLRRKAILHGHCHHKSLLKMNADEELLRRMQVDFDALESGCCGMAGAFGFEKGAHYDVSIKCGERVLLPRARAADEGEILLTDGFSCHEQILQQTGKNAMHLAQALELALQTGEREKPPAPKKEAPPETRRNHPDGHASHRSLFKIGAAAAVAAVAFTTLAQADKSKR
jgi:Fe-S oxidoreductase